MRDSLEQPRVHVSVRWSGILSRAPAFGPRSSGGTGKPERQSQACRSCLTQWEAGVCHLGTRCAAGEPRQNPVPSALGVDAAAAGGGSGGASQRGDL